MSETEKGQARAAGRSVHDVLATDAVPAPPPLLASAYDFLGDADLDAQRYTDARLCRQRNDKNVGQNLAMGLSGGAHSGGR